MRFIPSLVLLDRKSIVRAGNDSFDSARHSLVVVSFRHQNPHSAQSPFVMVVREDYADNKLEFAKVLWSTSHIKHALQACFDSLRLRLASLPLVSP